MVGVGSLNTRHVQTVYGRLGKVAAASLPPITDSISVPTQFLTLSVDLHGCEHILQPEILIFR